MNQSVEELQKQLRTLETEPSDQALIEAFKEACLARGRAEGFAEGVEDATTGLAISDDEILARGRAEGAELFKDGLERWLLNPENEDVSRTYVTSTYCQKDINVERVVDFLHDCIQLPASVLSPAPKEEK